MNHVYGGYWRAKTTHPLTTIARGHLVAGPLVKLLLQRFSLSVLCSDQLLQLQNSLVRHTPRRSFQLQINLAAYTTITWGCKHSEGRNREANSVTTTSLAASRHQHAKHTLFQLRLTPKFFHCEYYRAIHSIHALQTGTMYSQAIMAVIARSSMHASIVRYCHIHADTGKSRCTSSCLSSTFCLELLRLKASVSRRQSMSRAGRVEPQAGTGVLRALLTAGRRTGFSAGLPAPAFLTARRASATPEPPPAARCGSRIGRPPPSRLPLPSSACLAGGQGSRLAAC